jgi:uncharacterized protein (TIGR02145 family)
MGLKQKSTFRNYTWAIGFVFLLGACQTLELEEGGIDSAAGVKGQIVLPPGSNLDISSLTVLSNIDDSRVNGTSYGLEKGGKFTGLYVTNPNEEVVMMGFQYPGNPSNEINSTTTALGLIMTAPVFFSLNEEGMLAMINNVLNDPEFPQLKAEIEKNIVQGRPLFDLENTSLIALLSNIVKTAGLRITQNENELPVNLFKAGRNFTFNNSGKSFSTVIGIYKEENKLQSITVDGVQLVAGSLTELLTGTGGTFESPVDHPFTVPGDGQFTFKFRTGRPGSGDGSPEHDAAFYENLKQFSLYLLSGLLPQVDLEGTTGCVSSVSSNVFGTVSTLTSLRSNPNLGEVLLTVAEVTLSNVGGILEDCAPDGLKSGFFKFFIDQLNMLSIVSGAMNSGVFGFQWLSAEAVVDICYTAEGNEVSEGCGPEFDTIMDPRDGNEYKTVKIGNQVWFAENLRYAGNIPQVASAQAWSAIYNSGNPTGQPAWAYYNNDPNNDATYGKLYNWYAVNTGTLCPPGWHIPTDQEWTVLTNYLGGPEVAGGKMKSVTGWDAPNIGATNESGFTGLPGGSRHIYGGFGGLGSAGDWWSSSPNGAYAAWLCFLSRSDERVYRNYYSRTLGLSCRCLRD